MPRYSYTRRHFLKQSAAAAAAATFAGPYILSAAKPNEKLNVAVIGCGGRGGAHVNAARREHCVALCDVDAGRLGRAAGKVAGKKGPKPKTFSDYRKLFDAVGKEIDAVCVATPDHNHAAASMMAITRGKHVYCEKPLTGSIAEARALTEAARKHKVNTQMGNQGHCGEGYRVLCEWIWAGAIGEVREIHSWTNRPVWPQGFAKRPASKLAPKGLDWDCWIGPAPMRDYHPGLHPFKWRGYYDFGAGALGDMGCHIMDGAFWSMDAGYPIAAELVDVGGLNSETFPKWSHVRLDFPERKTKKKDNTDITIDLPAFSLHWWDGGKIPPIAAELARKYKRRFHKGGSTIYIGDEGTMYTGCYGGGVSILEPERMRAFAADRSDKTIPRAHGGSFSDFFHGCKTGRPSCSNFDYAGPFTEAVLMGNLVLRAGKGQKVEWDGKNMKVTTLPELNAHVGREYRKGWEL